MIESNKFITRATYPTNIGRNGIEVDSLENLESAYLFIPRVDNLKASIASPTSNHVGANPSTNRIASLENGDVNASFLQVASCGKAR
jgi:hypothetical protein